MEAQMMTKPIQLGDVAPDFSAETTQGPIKFHEWMGSSWTVFFSHPKDFTPVCTTELGEVARKFPEFQKRGTKVIALSVDPLESHKGWIADINETQNVKVGYPIIADPSREIANLYGMIHPKALDSFTVRTVFIIDPNKKVRLMITYPAPTGRNFDEILRVLDALQLTDKASVATPVNWKPGGDCIILPSIKDPEELKKKFPKGWKELKPYLRTTPQPEIN
jgi:thioredoxin-dependent peroxiredoxin